MTSIKSRGYVWASAASRHGPSAVRSLRTGIITDTRGRPAPPAPPPPRAARAGAARRSASRGVTELTLWGSPPAAVLGEDVDELLDVLVPVEPLLDDRAAAHRHLSARLGLAH